MKIKLKFSGPHIQIIIIMFLSLSILGLFSLFNFNLNIVIEKIKSSASIIVYLKEGIPQKNLINLQNEIKNIKFVDKVIYYSSENVLENFEKEFSDLPDIIKNLPENPLPSIFKIYLKENDEKKFEYVSKKIKKSNIVDDVDYGEYTIKKANNFFYHIKIFMYIITVILIFYILIVLTNAFTLFYFSKSDEIKILKLLGASSYFIKKPFYIKSVIYGLISSLLSLILLYCINYFLIDKFGLLNFLNINFVYINFRWILNFIVTAIILGFTGSYIALQKYF